MGSPPDHPWNPKTVAILDRLLLLRCSICPMVDVKSGFAVIVKLAFLVLGFLYLLNDNKLNRPQKNNHA
jgi:hypothetical protein